MDFSLCIEDKSYTAQKEHALNSRKLDRDLLTGIAFVAGAILGAIVK